ncbi:MAG: hypothetical protein M3235_14750 [Actinomycetota bacterium]|nr:hypothetical protein [Actinomycetota bacterium]
MVVVSGGLLALVLAGGVPGRAQLPAVGMRRIAAAAVVLAGVILLATG